LLHLHSMVVDKVGEPAGKTTQTDTSSNAQSRQVAGAAKRKARARSPPPKTAYPSAFSQRRPLSRMNQTFSPNPTDPSNAIFIPRGAGTPSLCSGGPAFPTTRASVALVLLLQSAVRGSLLKSAGMATNEK